MLPVVQEFYANTYEHETCQAFVISKRVAFDRTNINQYYSLPNINDMGITHICLKSWTGKK